MIFLAGLAAGVSGAESANGTTYQVNQLMAANVTFSSKSVLTLATKLPVSFKPLRGCAVYGPSQQLFNEQLLVIGTFVSSYFSNN